MKSNAPWSVKGIERDARETAKEAAKREGMTVGEWLNQMIYAAGEPQDSGGEVEGLKLRDIVTAIDHLHKRIADQSSETTESVTDLTRKMGEVVERTQRLERSKGDGGDRARIDALKALEKAVSQVAVQFNNAQKSTLERLDASESAIQSLSEQIKQQDRGGEPSDVAFLKDALDGLQTRMTRTERLATDASRASGADPEFIENTGIRLRVLGDEIKRGGDQIRALEGTIVKLSQQIEAAERRSAEGVQKTAETLAELRQQFSGDDGPAAHRSDIASLVADQTRDTVERVDQLQESFETMISRLEALTDKAAPVGAAALDETAADDGPTVPDADETIAALEMLDEIAEPNDHGPDDHETTQHHVEDDAGADIAATAGASADATADSEDDDFFSFADEIDASIEPDAEAPDDEELSFELDDAGDPATGDTESAEILSEVQDAFSGTDTAARTATADADLDELLAGLDDGPEPAAMDDLPDAHARPSDDVDLADTSAEDRADESGEDATTTTPDDAASGASPKEDLLKSIRRKAREDAAARAAEEEQERKTRRKLTPKQKAILAARARRKRLAEAKAENPDAADPEKVAAAKKALKGDAPAPKSRETAAAPVETTPRVDEDDDDAAGGFGARLSSLRSKLPFVGAKKNDSDARPVGAAHADTEAGADAETDDALSGDQAALETLKDTASARPVTLALAVGIFLAIGLLFFVIKDFIFPPEPRVGANAPAPAIVDNAATDNAAATPTFDAPSPPPIDPQTLYRDAMTGLSAAGNEVETAAAIEKLEQAAMLGHPPAQLQLGEFYKTGQGVDQNLSDARTWFRRAANGGNVLAMHRIGVMTARGEGGSANTPEAISWFEQAGNRGLVDSQYNLGAIYHPSDDGDASLQDAGKAYYWYSLAAKNGDAQADPLAAGVGAMLEDAQRQEIDAAIGAWDALPSDIEANTLAAAG